MTSNCNQNPYLYNPEPYDYYHKPKPSGCQPCPNPGLHAYPSPPWTTEIYKHNKDEQAHPYLLNLIKNITCNYMSVDSLTNRDSIKEESRKEGLMVYVVETDLVYRLEGGIANTNWVELNINSEQYIKLGRYNPPINPSIGTVYFDLVEERLKVYITDWLALPNMSDISQMIRKHNEDPEAHADRFKEVENIWLAI